MNRSRVFRLILALSSFAVAAGCQRGGMAITNTSDQPISFTGTMPGGKVEYTLQPGSVLELPRGARIGMSQYTIQAH
jgi:hypothetical protein